LQLHNFGLCGTGSVVWAAIFFGGLMQLVAGFHEFKTGNSFGYAVFSTYGAFWMALGGIFLGMHYGILKVGTPELGCFMLVFTLITVIFMIGSFKQHTVLALAFVTLLIGFICLDIALLGGVKIFTTIAAIDLTICSFVAWYLMAHIIYAQLGWNLPVGKAWIK